jgi:hypothetical protein
VTWCNTRHAQYLVEFTHTWETTKALKNHFVDVISRTVARRLAHAINETQEETCGTRIILSTDTILHQKIWLFFTCVKILGTTHTLLVFLQEK